MGRGNYYPTGAEEGRLDYFYIELGGYEKSATDDEIQDSYDMDFAVMKDAIFKAMPSKTNFSKRWLDDEMILADHEDLMVTCADNQNTTAVMLRYKLKRNGEPTEKSLSLGYRVIKEIFDIGFPVSIRTSAWTSGRVEYLSQITSYTPKVYKKEQQIAVTQDG